MAAIAMVTVLANLLGNPILEVYNYISQINDCKINRNSFELRTLVNEVSPKWVRKTYNCNPSKINLD